MCAYFVFQPVFGCFFYQHYFKQQKSQAFILTSDTNVCSLFGLWVRNYNESPLKLVCQQTSLTFAVWFFALHLLVVFCFCLGVCFLLFFCFFFFLCLVNSPSMNELWLGPDTPSNLKSQHRVKRARVLQRKPLYTATTAPKETLHTRLGFLFF